METVIYHNSRCSKSRGTMALLEERGIEPTVVFYLETPPTAVQIADLVVKLGLPVTSLIRFKETRAKELGIAHTDERSDKQWCELLAANPGLLERPVVVRGDRAVIGRPPENVLALID